jgi:hypothetical protein
MNTLDGAAYFATAVSYAHKIFMKSMTGVNVYKTFFSVANI